MTKFRYRVEQDGHEVEGPIEADSIEEARERLEHNFPEAKITIQEV